MGQVGWFIILAAVRVGGRLDNKDLAVGRAGGPSVIILAAVPPDRPVGESLLIGRFHY